ncbi:MAG: hypothetical protein RLN62_02135 [Rickettsiales bacterium]
MQIDFFEITLNNILLKQKVSFKTEEKNTGDYVILLHGYLHSSRCMERVKIYLEEKNFVVLNCSYPSVRHSVEQLANNFLKDFINRFCTDKRKKIHFIGHSFGSIILRKYLLNNPSLNAGKFIMICPPLRGSIWANLAKRIPVINKKFGPAINELSTSHYYSMRYIAKIVPTLVITAKYDFMVRGYNVPEEAKHRVIRSFHLMILKTKKLNEEIFDFLVS